MSGWKRFNLEDKSTWPEAEGAIVVWDQFGSMYKIEWYEPDTKQDYDRFRAICDWRPLDESDLPDYWPNG